MIKAIIFDFFGVLVGKGFEYTYRTAGGNPASDHLFIEDMLGQSNLGMITQDEFNQAMSNNLGIRLDQWLKAVKEAEKADNELLNYIVSLRKNYKTALLTNSNRGVVREKVGEARLEECFDIVIVSADVGLVKPDPAIYDLTAEKLGVQDKECVFIDDRKPFVEAAKGIGMTSILYQDSESLIDQLNNILD
jgi:epoxide hydrolase-like predicted phosphatase